MLRLDAEVTAAIEPLAAAAGDSAPPERGDWLARRARADGLMQLLIGGRSFPEQVRWTDYDLEVSGGECIHCRWYTTGAVTVGPGVMYLHGGGMIAGSVELYHPSIARYVHDSGVPMLAVDYRLAPEHPAPAAADDCYQALVWFAAHAGELGVDVDRVAVMGDSAGGGLAAGVALQARDRGGPVLAFQILVYPMLDDRNTTPDTSLEGLSTWSYDDNITAWQAVLGEFRGSAGVSPYVAPARADDLSGLPRSYLEVGELDIFRDETVAYATRLHHSGVSAELHVVAGAPHGFDVIAPDARVAARCYALRLDAMRAF